MLRNEIYRKIYTNNVYEANQFTGMNPRTRESRDSIAAIKDFVDRGIYTRPEKVPDFFKAYEEKNKD